MFAIHALGSHHWESKEGTGLQSSVKTVPNGFSQTWPPWPRVP